MRKTIGDAAAALSLVLLLGLYGCSAALQGTYVASEIPNGMPKGKILALAADDDTVVVATKNGLFQRSSGGSWEEIQVPGLKTMRLVSSLALMGDELFVGTLGEGLYVYSGGTWEIKTAEYEGLPDDNVYCLALDKENKGLPDIDVWVGTQKGLAIRRKGQWELYSPKGNWLRDLVGKPAEENDSYHVSSGFRLGKPDEDRKSFSPPVTAISVGNQRVVLGSKNSRLAVIDQDGFATIQLTTQSENQMGMGKLEIINLLVDPDVLWVGTDKGLLWGGLAGHARGRPYPSWKMAIPNRTVLYNSKDSRPYDYTFYLFGENNARVTALARDGEDGLWVGFKAGVYKPPRSYAQGTDEGRAAPFSGVRRYINVDEHVASKKKSPYEKYSGAYGIRQPPTAFAFAGTSGDIWIGTESGLFYLKK